MLKPIALFCLALLPLTTNAAIEKYATSCGNRICFHWWPKVPAIPGWHQDRERNFDMGVNLLVPNDRGFSDAPAVIYARAVYKPRVPEVKSLDALIEQDRRTFLAEKPDGAVAEAGKLTTGDGHRLRSLTFFAPHSGSWERVAYGEEGDFYLIFTLSAQDKASYEHGTPLFEAWVGRYREAL